MDFEAVKPVEGLVVRVSESARMKVAVHSFLYLLAGLGLGWWVWQLGGFSYHVLVIVVVALVCLIAGIVSLFMEFALVLGRDRLQNIRNGRVIGQIPYRNIADITLCASDGCPCLGIKLWDEEDPDTFWERQQARWYKKSRRAWGYDVFITPDSTVPIDRILETIQAGRNEQEEPDFES